MKSKLYSLTNKFAFNTFENVAQLYSLQNLMIAVGNILRAFNRRNIKCLSCD